MDENQRRHEELVEGHTRLLTAMTRLETAVEKDVTKIVETLDAHSRHLYGEGEEKPGILARLRDIEQKDKWRKNLFMTAWTFVTGGVGILIGILSFMFGKDK